MASVIAVCISELKGTIKNSVSEIRVVEGFGIEGDAHAGDVHAADSIRQVSLLAVESVDKLRDRIPNLDAGVFAENILTEGICLHELPIGARLQINDVLLEVTQIGKECHNDGCAIKKQTGECVMPREGIFAKVLKSGTIKPDDEIQVDN